MGTIGQGTITEVSLGSDEVCYAHGCSSMERATIYPPALAAVLPEVTQLAGKAAQQGIERDHQHLKGRYRPKRGFQRVRTARVICAGHGFMRNPRDGFYRLGFVWHGPDVPHAPRLQTA